MATYIENYSTARRLLKHIKMQHTCSHDLIPREELPHLYADQMELYLQQFGRRRLEEYLQHIAITELHFKTIMTHCRQHNYPSPIMTSSYAVSLTGVGECQVVSTRLIADILNSGRTDCMLVLIKNHRQPYLPYRDHCIVLLGVSDEQISFRQNDFSVFLSSLPSTCVVIDSLLNYIGPPNRLLVDKAIYYNHLELRTILQVMTYDSSHLAMIKTIINDAHQLVKASQLPCKQRLDFTHTSEYKLLFKLESNLERVNATCSDTPLKDHFQPKSILAFPVPFFCRDNPMGQDIPSLHQSQDREAGASYSM